MLQDGSVHVNVLFQGWKNIQDLMRNVHARKVNAHSLDNKSVEVVYTSKKIYEHPRLPSVFLVVLWVQIFWHLQHTVHAFGLCEFLFLIYTGRRWSQSLLCFPICQRIVSLVTFDARSRLFWDAVDSIDHQTLIEDLLISRDAVFSGLAGFHVLIWRISFAGRCGDSGLRRWLRL